MHVLDETYFLDTLRQCLSIDSTTSQYGAIQDWLSAELARLNVAYTVTRKGGVIAEIPSGRNPASAGPLCVTAHLDDIGLMVRRINADGTLNVCPVGGIYPFYCVTENVRVYTRDGIVFTGTVCRVPNSIHVTEEELSTVLPDFRKNVAVVLDEAVRSAADVRALGIDTGDLIALEPRFTISNGYLKSRFIDDKAAAAILLTAIKAVAEGKLTTSRKIYAYFSMYEEISHGTAWCPPDIADMLAIDIAPTGPDQTSDEHKVSIFAKDSRYPYHWEMTNELRSAAQSAGIDYVMDVFTPHYGTDDDVTIAAGYDIRHAAIGPGTSNSHGYERTHMDGIRNTYALLAEYLQF